jgi:hypothetical protein
MNIGRSSAFNLREEKWHKSYYKVLKAWVSTSMKDVLKKGYERFSVARD